MQRKFGLTCILLGTVLILSALFLMLYNNMESQNADTASAQVLTRIRQDSGEGEVKAGNVLLEEEHVDAFDPELRKAEDRPLPSFRRGAV